MLSAKAADRRGNNAFPEIHGDSPWRVAGLRNAIWKRLSGGADRNPEHFGVWPVSGPWQCYPHRPAFTYAPSRRTRVSPFSKLFCWLDIERTRAARHGSQRLGRLSSGQACGSVSFDMVIKWCPLITAMQQLADRSRWYLSKGDSQRTIRSRVTVRKANLSNSDATSRLSTKLNQPPTGSQSASPHRSPAPRQVNRFDADFCQNGTENRGNRAVTVGQLREVDASSCRNGDGAIPEFGPIVYPWPNILLGSVRPSSMSRNDDGRLSENAIFVDESSTSSGDNPGLREPSPRRKDVANSG